MSLMVRFVLPAESDNPGLDKLCSALKETVPDYAELPESTQIAELPHLLLVPVEYPIKTALIEQSWNNWINKGMGTVLRLSDGKIVSRIIPVSMRPGTKASAELKFYLDGADDPVVVVGDDDSQDRRAFLTLLTDMLSVSMPGSTSKPDLDAFESYIRRRFKTDFPPLSYHNPDHIQDVYVSALRIADSEGIDEEGKNLLRVATLLHDAGFIHTSVNHEKRGAEMAGCVLPVFGFSTSQISIVQEMILATKVPQRPISHLDRIICDADLDYLGRDDFYSIGGKLYMELLASGVVKDDKSWNALQKKFLEAHRYHTNFSKANREPEKQERLKEIISLVG